MAPIGESGYVLSRMTASGRLSQSGRDIAATIQRLSNGVEDVAYCPRQFRLPFSLMKNSNPALTALANAIRVGDNLQQRL
jgi:hypothetical protein